ncbi:glycerophosphodiesterase [Enterococcus phoeniculicola]|jgi:glycerophosphoryl diester phosphodiesterase|uniref:Glycerophosphodiesterase n=1 Tax=Enterococcus phoeniculicola ATCC BAA-412 TaxID=1158610 RepID=R3U5T0_9ENTE|nr:glycerophosphodiester phosphodiesterase [Enterococcus phoeniculicola]EOL48773.1 glycerophosphodiesterase [Enterococcus phoeniculicola ATCC BAA-412]EOT72619.1 glycerophosphodiesterase [Enterococcus phoeniculicola ATCC BAA-412]OJG71893.1 glycerophosphodiesterase [Enterococcus phoeniculicola]
MTQVMAHRGSSGTRPENTLPAFSEAVRAEADGIELDVHLTKDQVLVVMHDEEVDRTTNGQGRIREMTLAEIKTLNAGSWFDKEFSAARVPTLKEVLDLLVQKNFRGFLNIEIKTDKFDYPGIEEAVSSLMMSQQWPFTHWYSSFNMKSLEKMHHLEPDTQLDYIMGTAESKVKQALERSFIEGIHPKINWIRESEASFLSFPKAVRPWTINESDDMLACFEQNLTGIITDFPEKAVRLRRGMKK